ncbi:MAG: histidine phosphatase family protein [Alphaproteobacteria bacterium]|nr:histidine phosphatase family protein [Alphaproteobacteria bacterium]
MAAKIVKIYMVRHGETFDNVENKMSGQKETELTEKGKRQALVAGEKLKEKGICPDVILCSPLSRAVNTANLINESFGVNVIRKKDLQEYYFGDYEGAKIEEFEKIVFSPPHVCGDVMIHNGKEMRYYHGEFDQKYNVVFFPNGETKQQAIFRFLKEIESYLAENKDVDNLLIVAHGAIMRFVLCSISMNILTEKVKNGEVYEVCYSADRGFFVD